MAKNNISKIIGGVAVIGAGVALGLAIYNRLDTIKRELNDDEFEDDMTDEEMDDSDEASYVTLNTVLDTEADESTESDDADENETTDDNDSESSTES